MSKAYFQSPLIGLSQSIVDGGQSLVKRCLIAIEGVHTCNKGKRYEMPADFMQDLGDNLNTEISNGRIIPFFRDHNKSAESEFGKLQGFVECRPVVESDLPNPEARGMLGKLALFGNVNITRHLDLVRSGAIKALSPGIDITRRLIFEVSSVPVASMPGVGLFSLYDDVKADRSRVTQLRDGAIECVDTFVEAIRMVERQGGEMTASLSGKQESFDRFVEDLREHFEIPVAEGGIEYSQNPYDKQVVRAGFGMSTELNEGEKEDVLDEVSKILANEAESVPRKTLARRTRSSGGNFASRGRLALAQGTS